MRVRLADFDAVRHGGSLPAIFALKVFLSRTSVSTSGNSGVSVGEPETIISTTQASLRLAGLEQGQALHYGRQSYTGITARSGTSTVSQPSTTGGAMRLTAAILMLLSIRLTTRASRALA